MSFKPLRKIAYALGFAVAAYFSLGAIKNIKEVKQKYLFSAPFSAVKFPFEREQIVIPVSELMSLYTDCDQKIYTHRTFSYTKTKDEIARGVKKRRGLEELWSIHFQEQIVMLNTQDHYVDTTQKWQNPLRNFSWFGNSFNDPRIREGRWKVKHEAIDIFAKIGSDIHTPVSGIVVASANDWDGSWDRRKGLQYHGGGLGKLSGNGIILFNPTDTSYYFMIHMKDVYARSGDVVSRGDTVGTVGITGNAISPNVVKHLHFAHKKPGNGCGIEGVLVAENPYWNLRETLSLQLAQKN